MIDVWDEGDAVSAHLQHWCSCCYLINRSVLFLLFSATCLHCCPTTLSSPLGTPVMASKGKVRGELSGCIPLNYPDTDGCWCLCFNSLLFVLVQSKTIRCQVVLLAFKNVLFFFCLNWLLYILEKPSNYIDVTYCLTITTKKQWKTLQWDLLKNRTCFLVLKWQRKCHLMLIFIDIRFHICQ